MIQPAQKVYDAKKFETEVHARWQAGNVYEKVKLAHAKDPTWFFLDGPPYASGTIHLGTAWNKIIKDVVIRYKTMRGFNVRKQPGWDCHGLPIEVKVEEKLGVKSKKDIEQTIGVEKFIDECKRWALEHVDIMTKQFKRLGVWMDWDAPYITITNDYIESAWWTIKRAHERGLMQKDMRVIHWCPRCETALAEHEVRGEYLEVKDPSLYVRFKIIDKPNEYLLIWTTTPWTLPADMAVCVHPEYSYARVSVGNDVYTMAEPLVAKVMSELGVAEYRIIDLTKGDKLDGLRYEHPLLEEVPKQKEFTQHHRVICGDHVTLEEGTGCVHTAPGHGEEDFVIGVKYGLPVFSPVGPDGKFTNEAGEYVGQFVKNADSVILEDLKQKGILMKSGTITHTYPYCWRCHTPLIFRATEQWFIRISDIKTRILEKNSAHVQWAPDWVKMRYINGVESVGDWCISRQRYWGIPLPIWSCGCGNVIIVGSKEELEQFAQVSLTDVDLHRPGVDRLVIKCTKCNGEMRRVPDVLDVWFDSGIASWASLGYPKQRELFEKIWPSDFITEGEDQVTKWFYSQQATSVIAFDDVPYKQVLMHGFVLDANGRKMSKSLGNVVEPEEVVGKFGADVLRFYTCSANAPWEDLRFNWKGIDVVNRMLNVLWNVYVFATTYMALDKFDPTNIYLLRIRDNFTQEDAWILSRVNSLARDVERAFESYNIHLATRELSSFILEDLSRWYVKLIRNRMWIESEDPSKLAAYVTLYQVMHVLMRLLAPLMPHVTEVIYQGLVKSIHEKSPESVHMLSWPVVQDSMIDLELERGMNAVRAFVDAAANIRQQANLKLRWPVQKAIVQASTQELKVLLMKLESVLRSQLNCKELVLLGPDDVVGELKCKPKVESLTKRFKSLAPAVEETLKNMEPLRLRAELERYGFFGIQVVGQKVKLTKDDVEFEVELPEGFASASTDAGKIMIDVRLTPQLKAECLARELVRRLQTMRKEQDLAMEERVDVEIGSDNAEYLKLLATQREYIIREVRVQNLRLCAIAEVGTQGYIKDWEIDGDKFKLSLKRLSA